VDLDFKATRVRVKNLKIKSRGSLGLDLSFGIDDKNRKIALQDVQQQLLMNSEAVGIEPGEIVFLDEKGNEKDSSGNPLTPQIPGLAPSDPAEMSATLSEVLKKEFQRNKEAIIEQATPTIVEAMTGIVKKIVAQEINPKLEEISSLGLTQDLTWVVNGVRALPEAGLSAQYCLAGADPVSRPLWTPEEPSGDLGVRLKREDLNALLAQFRGKSMQFGEMKITPDAPIQARVGPDGRIYARFEGQIEHPALANLKIEGSKVRGVIEAPIRLIYENGILKPFLDLPEDGTAVDSALSLRVPTRDRETGKVSNTLIEALVRFTRVQNKAQARVILKEGAVSSLVNYAQTTGLVPAVIPIGEGRSAELIQPVRVLPDVSAGPIASEGATISVFAPQVRVPIPRKGEIAKLRGFDDPATGDPWEYVDLDLNLRAQVQIEEVDGEQKLRVYLPPSRPGAEGNHLTRGVRAARILNVAPEQANGLGAVANALGFDWVVSGEFAKETIGLQDRVQAEISRRPVVTLSGGRFSDAVRHPDGVLRYVQVSRKEDGEVRMKTEVLKLPTGAVQVTMSHPESGAFLGRYSFSETSAEGRMYLDQLARGTQGQDLRYRFTPFEDPPQSGRMRWSVQAIDSRFRVSEHPEAVLDHVRQNLKHDQVEMTTNVTRSGDSGVRVRMIDARTGRFLGEYRYSDQSAEGRMYLEQARIHGPTSPMIYRAIRAGASYQLEAIDPNRDGKRPLFEFSLDDPRAKPYLDLVTSAARTHAGAELRVAQPTTTQPLVDGDRQIALGVDLIGERHAPQVALGEVNVEKLLNSRIAERASGVVPEIKNTELKIDPKTGDIVFMGDFRRP
jgi:predicted DNA-binding antitoxin AbrB/MazE fold protein